MKTVTVCNLSFPSAIHFGPTWCDGRGVETLMQHSGITSYRISKQYNVCIDFLYNWRCIHLPRNKSVWKRLQWYHHFGSKYVQYSHSSIKTPSSTISFLWTLKRKCSLTLGGGGGDASSVYVRFSTLLPNETSQDRDKTLSLFEYNVRMAATLCTLICTTKSFNDEYL